MTKVISVHKLRRRARARERRLQKVLNRHGVMAYELQRAGLPIWCSGVRVEKAGPFQWAVVATTHRGT